MQETSASESSACGRGEDTAGRQITNLEEIRFRGGYGTARVEDTPKVAVTKRLFPHPVLIPELNHSRVGERGAFPLYANEWQQQQQQKRARYVNVARYFISASQTAAKVGSAGMMEIFVGATAMQFATLTTAKKSAEPRRDQ